MQNRQCNKIYLPGKISTALKVVIYRAMAGITDYLVLAFPAFVLITEKFSLAKLP